MIRLIIPVYAHRYPEDVDRIIQVCTEAGYEIDRSAAEFAWETQSNDFAAQWLGLPDSDEELLTIIRSHLEEVT